MTPQHFTFPVAPFQLRQSMKLCCLATEHIVLTDQLPKFIHMFEIEGLVRWARHAEASPPVATKDKAQNLGNLDGWLPKISLT